MDRKVETLNTESAEQCEPSEVCTKGRTMSQCTADSIATSSGGRMKRYRIEDASCRPNSFIDALEGVLKRYGGSENASQGGLLGPYGKRDAPIRTSKNDRLGAQNEDVTQYKENPIPESAVSPIFEQDEPAPGVLGSILYDLSRVLQSKTSTYDALQLLYNAVQQVKEKEHAIHVIKQRRRQHNVARNLYQQLMSRRMDRRMVEPKLIAQQMKRVARKFKRAINVWAHHCCIDEIDDSKPYNEPPQVRCIRFDRTGKVIITGGDEGIIKLWHTFNCTLITSLRKHAGGIMCLDVHPNNFFIVSCCDGGELWLWEINGNLYRPHKKITIPFKYLWCRFLLNGGKRNPSDLSDRCQEEIRNTLVVSVSANSKLTIYRMNDLLTPSSGSNITNEVEPLYTVELFNHNIKTYDVSRPLMHDKSALIALGIEPMFLEELRMSDDATSSALAMLQVEALGGEHKAVRGKYGKISSSALCILFNVSTGQVITAEHTTGGRIEDDTVGNSGSGDECGSDPASAPGGAASEFCVCDINLDLITDPAGSCKCCLKSVRSIAFPSSDSGCLEEYPVKLKMESSEAHMDSKTTDGNKRAATTFDWNGCRNELEMYISRAIETYDLGDDIRIVENVTFGSANMPIGRLTSTLLFPSYIESPCDSEENANAENRDPGNFDELIYHVQRGHETSPDVCFANQSLNHVTASDDGKVFLWVQCNKSIKFKGTSIFTKCLNKWLSKADSTTSRTEERIPSVLDPAFTAKPPINEVHTKSSLWREDKTIVRGTTKSDRIQDGIELSNYGSNETIVQTTGGVPTSQVLDCVGLFDNYSGVGVDVATSGCNESPLPCDATIVTKSGDRNIGTMEKTVTLLRMSGNSLEEVDDFATDDVPKPEMMEEGSESRKKKAAKLFKIDDIEKQNMQESGHHYVITDITWSRLDRYIFIADSIVTRYNVKKLITASRTIMSGVSVFNSKGDRVADFLHMDISHHVGCVKPHPVTEDIGLAITYGGVIYVFSVEQQTIIKKFDCGPNAVWLDADWHPTGLYFAACQSFGCFSIFTLDGLANTYRSTLNHQCGYSDLLSGNTGALYHGAENDSVQLRRYYHGSSLMPPVELQGKRSDESLRMFTVHTINTVLDETRYEVLYVSNDVPMQVDDTAIWRNRVLDTLSVPSELKRIIEVTNRIPMDVGIIEFIQWHWSTYPQCVLTDLVLWFLHVNGLSKLIQHSPTERFDGCPYGGSTCHVCLYISNVDERAERYSQIYAGYRGMRSRVNDRGDIIACLPISARPQASTQHVAATTGERRTITSPISRVQSISTGNRIQHNVRSHTNSRSSMSSRILAQPRPQPTRIQPPRGQQTSRVPPSTARDDATTNTDAGTVPTSRRQDIGATTSRTLRSAGRTVDECDSTEVTPTRTNVKRGNELEEADNYDDDRASRRARREMVSQDSCEEDSTPERGSSGYSFRNRKSTRDLQRERDIEHARYISSVLGPLGLSQLAWKEPNTQDIPCALCGFATETSRSKRTNMNKAWIGGSKLAKNALIGPFATTRRFMDMLEEELPRVFDRLGKSVFMHNGCLAAATYLSLDPSGRRIVNFPEVMVRGLYTRCSYCSNNFATLHCCSPDCGRAFHYPCAMFSFEDELYQSKQPTARRNPSFLTRLENVPDPLTSDRFVCLECTLKSWVDGSPSLEPFCTGEIFMGEQHRTWFYGDARDDWPTVYVPQGGDLIIVSTQPQGNIKGNSATMWSFQAKSQLMAVKKLDYRFYGMLPSCVHNLLLGPIAGQFGVCAVMSLLPIEDKKRVPLFYYPGELTVYPLVELMMGLWRLNKVSSGNLVKVRCSDGWKEAVVRSVNKPYICGKAMDVIPGDFGMVNVALIAKAAVNMGASCIQVEPDAILTRKWFSAWEVIVDTAEESKLLDDIKQLLFPPEAKQQLINLTLDPEYEEFNTIPTCEDDTTEEWVRTYWMTIPNPMSLEKVRQRILNSYYLCPQGAFADLDVIVQNCRSFNDPSSEIWHTLTILERGISTAREDIRRVMNNDKYGRAVMQRIWPDIEPFFSRPEEEIDENGTTNYDLDTATGNTQDQPTGSYDSDGDVPIRRSSRLIQAKSSLSSPLQPPPPQPNRDQDTGESGTPRRRLSKASDVQRNVSRYEPETHISMGEGRAMGSRRSSRLAQIRTVCGSSEGGSVSSQEWRDKRNTSYSHTNSISSIGMSEAETNSVDNEGASQETQQQQQHQMERRHSSRVAEITKKETERRKQLEMQREERERLVKLQRYSSVRYNLRER